MLYRERSKVLQMQNNTAMKWKARYE